MAGELSLAGELQPIRGALALALALHREGLRTRDLPADSARAAAQVGGVDVRGAQTLAEAWRRCCRRCSGRFGRARWRCRAAPHPRA